MCCPVKPPVRPASPHVLLFRVSHCVCVARARARARACARSCVRAVLLRADPADRLPASTHTWQPRHARAEPATGLAGQALDRPHARNTAGRTRRKGAAPCVSPAAGLRGARKRRVPAGGSRRHPSVTEHAPAGPRQAGAPAPAPAEVRRAETPVRALSRDPQAPAASTRRRRRHGAPGRRCSCARFDWPAERDPVNGRRTYHRPARWLPAPAGCGA